MAIQFLCDNQHAKAADGCGWRGSKRFVLCFLSGITIISYGSRLLPMKMKTPHPQFAVLSRRLPVTPLLTKGDLTGHLQMICIERIQVFSVIDERQVCI